MVIRNEFPVSTFLKQAFLDHFRIKKTPLHRCFNSNSIQV